MQEYQVGLEDVRFFAYHGLFSEERILGNWFTLTVRVAKRVDTFTFERLDQTFDYGVIYDICREIMAEPVDLLETVASQISERLKSSFEGLSRYEIHVTKDQPPLGMKKGKSCVSLIEQMDL
ncbi:MAG: Dihydroneopterin aldolase [Bacteroidota bacterium]|jgi:dihydroneopterin aldolase